MDKRDCELLKKVSESGNYHPQLGLERKRLRSLKGRGHVMFKELQVFGLAPPMWPRINGSKLYSVRATAQETSSMDEDWKVLMSFLPRQRLATETGALKGLRKDKSVEKLLRTLLLHVGCPLRETAVRTKEANLADFTAVALAVKEIEGLVASLVCRTVSRAGPRGGKRILDQSFRCDHCKGAGQDRSALADSLQRQSSGSGMRLLQGHRDIRPRQRRVVLADSRRRSPRQRLFDSQENWSRGIYRRPCDRANEHRFTVAGNGNGPTVRLAQVGRIVGTRRCRRVVGGPCGGEEGCRHTKTDLRDPENRRGDRDGAGQNKERLLAKKQTVSTGHLGIRPNPVHHVFRSCLRRLGRLVPYPLVGRTRLQKIQVPGAIGASTEIRRRERQGVALRKGRPSGGKTDPSCHRSFLLGMQDGNVRVAHGGISGCIKSRVRSNLVSPSSKRSRNGMRFRNRWLKHGVAVCLN